MVLTDDAAFALLIVFGLFLLVLALLGLVGFYLAGRGNHLLGAALTLSVLGFIFGPALVDHIRTMPLRTALEARSTIPESLDLTGQRVLFIETGTSICAEICGDVLRLGTDVEAYWIGAGGQTRAAGADHPLLGILTEAEFVLRVALGDPVDDAGGRRYAEEVSQGAAPPYDVVIVFDDSGQIALHAPHLLGDPLPDGANVQFSTLVFTDWPDPYAGPPPMPAFFSISAWVETRPILWWPFSGTRETYPSLTEATEAWGRALCAGAGDASSRGVATYSELCGRPSVAGTE